MKLQEPDFISIQEAAVTFNISVERLRWQAEKGLLPVYVAKSSGGGSDAEKVYAKVIAPQWSVDSLEFCKAVILDREGNPVDELTEVMYPIGHSYSMVMIRPDELRALEQAQARVSDSSRRPARDTIERLCQQLKDQNLTDKEIARKLKTAFPGISNLQIGTLLPANPGATIVPDSHRKRGKRLLE